MTQYCNGLGDECRADWHEAGCSDLKARQQAKEARLIHRRRYHGNLNVIPLAIAYDFELDLIIANNPADGFKGSAHRIAAAKEEQHARVLRENA